MDATCNASGSRDVRDHGPDHLAYPAASLVVLAGIPGAGKTTLLRRLYATGDEARIPSRRGPVRILDPEQILPVWQRWLGPVPYRWWRPLLHLAHYTRVCAAVGQGGPVVVSDCGTRPWVRRLLGALAVRRGLAVHLVLLDASPDDARTGQRTRGRAVGAASFDAHCRRWRGLVRAMAATRDPGRLVPGAASAVLLDREAAGRLRTLAFSEPDAVSAYPGD